jgi:hypothetical protein
MKKLGYYPALIFLLMLCSTGVAVCVFLSAGVLKSMTNYKNSDDAYKASVKQLEAEKASIEENEKIDKSYEELLEKWREKEGGMDETRLKQKMQKIAEEAGVNVYEVGPLWALEKDEGEAAAQFQKKNTRRPRVQRPINLSGNTPSAAPGINAPLAETGRPIEFHIVLLGSFTNLMQWLERAENELGGLRVVQTRWVARSPEEIKLTVGVRYKTIGGSL